MGSSVFYGYIAVIGIIFFIYGVLIGKDDGDAGDVGAVVFSALIWPVLVLPVLGFIVGSAIKRLRSAK